MSEKDRCLKEFQRSVVVVSQLFGLRDEVEVNKFGSYRFTSSLGNGHYFIFVSALKAGTI